MDCLVQCSLQMKRDFLKGKTCPSKLLGQECGSEQLDRHALTFQKPCKQLRFIKELCCQMVKILTVFQHVHFYVL